MPHATRTTKGRTPGRKIPKFIEAMEQATYDRRVELSHDGWTEGGIRAAGPCSTQRSPMPERQRTFGGGVHGREKLTDFMSATIPARTRRDVRVPGIPGKALAVIGVRRGGKTSLLHERMAARVAEGRARESQLLLELEDERLAGITAQDLGWIIL